MGWINRRLIAVSERITGQNADYLRDMDRYSPGSFGKFLQFMRFAAHRKTASKEAYAIARLAATHQEDCGPCVQIVIDMALKEGVAASLLRTGLESPDDLPAPYDLIYRYGRAVAANDDTVPEIIDTVERTLGKKVQTDLAIAVATARVFPTLKRGLGYALSCSRVEVTVT